MKNLRGWWVALGLVGSTMADDSVDTDNWPGALQVLKAVAAEPMPSKPVDWQSPDGPFVLHGDLFGDGRHLALVGTTRTTLAQGTKEGWRILSSEDVFPLWAIRKFSHLTPPPTPFALKDLDGDHVPEVLIAFNNDGCDAGYRIAKKSGEGMKLLSLNSERGEPEVEGGFTKVVSLTSGRKAWWSGTTYHQWRKGVPYPVATWIEDSSRDLKGVRLIALRHAGGEVSKAFEIEQENGVDWSVRSCVWKGGVETSDQKPLAKVRFKMDPASSGDDHNFLAEMVLMFELSTGIKGTASILPKGNQVGFDPAKATAGLRVEVEGSEQAKKLLKRIP